MGSVTVTINTTIQSAYAILSNGLLQECNAECRLIMATNVFLVQLIACTSSSWCAFIDCVFFSSWEILGSVELYFQQKITCSSEVVSYT